MLMYDHFEDNPDYATHWCNFLDCPKILKGFCFVF